MLLYSSHGPMSYLFRLLVDNSLQLLIPNLKSKKATYFLMQLKFSFA